jgi:hypothetical protein
MVTDAARGPAAKPNRGEQNKESDVDILDLLTIIWGKRWS